MNSGPNRAAVAREHHDYFAAFYDSHRRHSSIGEMSPSDFQREHYAAINGAA